MWLGLSPMSDLLKVSAPFIRSAAIISLVWMPSAPSFGSPYSRPPLRDDSPFCCKLASPIPETFSLINVVDHREPDEIDNDNNDNDNDNVNDNDGVDSDLEHDEPWEDWNTAQQYFRELTQRIEVEEQGRQLKRRYQEVFVRKERNVIFNSQVKKSVLDLNWRIIGAVGEFSAHGGTAVGNVKASVNVIKKNVGDVVKVITTGKDVKPYSIPKLTITGKVEDVRAEAVKALIFSTHPIYDKAVENTMGNEERQMALLTRQLADDLVSVDRSKGERLREIERAVSIIDDFTSIISPVNSAPFYEDVSFGGGSLY